VERRILSWLTRQGLVRFLLLYTGRPASRFPPPPKLIAIPAIGPNLQPGIEGKEESSESTGLIRKVFVSAMDTQLFRSRFQIERKQITFDLKENPKGMFLRITEEVSGRRNAIIIPMTGLEEFRNALNDVMAFNQTLVGSGTILPLGRRDAETPGS
jgi:hypothetical protein